MPRGQRNGAPKGAPQAPAVPDELGASAVDSHKEPIAVAPAAEPEPVRPYDYASLSHAERENPEKLQGEDLRRLAHARGLSRSEIGRCSDQKLREQLRYVAYSQYDR